MHGRLGHTCENPARRHLQNLQVQATIFGELPHRRKLASLRLSHQAFRKHRQSQLRCPVQSFAVVVVVWDSSSRRLHRRVLVEVVLPTCLYLRCRREVVVVAVIWKVVSVVVVVVLARNSVVR